MAQVEQRTIAYGDAGIEQTLNIMADAVDASLRNPSVIAFARALALRADGRDQRAQAYVIRAWLARSFRFIQDPPDFELLRDPVALLMEWQALGYVMGDCDEAAMLGAALGKGAGLRAEFTAVATADPTMPTPPYTHVFATLLTDDAAAIRLDVTAPSGPVPQAVRTMTMDI